MCLAFGPQARADDQQASAADQGIEVHELEEGTSSRWTRRAAISALPLAQLSPEARQRANAVIDNISVFRRLPVVQCEADPRVFRFFTENPDMAVAVWQAMGISELTLKADGPGRYTTDSGDGSAGVITVLYRTEREQLILCEGLFKSPVLPKAIQARSLMHLKVDSAQNSAGANLSTCRADVYVSFPSNAIEAAVRTITPVSNRIADRNFHEVAMFIRMMHVAMTKQPGWVEQIVGQMEGVTPQQREALLNLTAEVYVDAARRNVQLTSGALTPEDLRLPTRREPEAAAEAHNSPFGTAVRTAVQPGGELVR
jgi:hypothetical protein